MYRRTGTTEAVRILKDFEHQNPNECAKKVCTYSMTLRNVSIPGKYFFNVNYTSNKLSGSRNSSEIGVTVKGMCLY